MSKRINELKRSDFEALRQREWGEDIGVFDSLIILPSKRLHDSGYRCMDFVAVKGEAAICRLSRCSDVINIEGIGGLGYNWFEKYKFDPPLINPAGWSIDCLKTSGLLRIFCDKKMVAGNALSSFEIFSINKDEYK